MPWVNLNRRLFERDPLACPVCEQAMTPLALVRSGAHGVLSSGAGRLGRTGELVLHGPPPRGDPAGVAHGLV
jgi:hypothetical protein